MTTSVPVDAVKDLHRRPRRITGQTHLFELLRLPDVGDPCFLLTALMLRSFFDGKHVPILPPTSPIRSSPSPPRPLRISDPRHLRIVFSFPRLYLLWKWQ